MADHLLPSSIKYFINIKVGEDIYSKGVKKGDGRKR